MNYNPFDEPEKVARKSLRVAVFIAVLITVMVVW